MTRFFAAAICAVAATSVTFAEANQPPGGGRGGFGRQGAIGAAFMTDLQMKEVQEDLKLTDDEKAKIAKLKDELSEGDKKFAESMQGVDREERMEKMNARRDEVTKQVKEALGDKYARFSQIRMQLDGLYGSVTRNREVAEKLSITEDQRTELREAVAGIFQPGGGGERPSPEKMREMMEEMQKKGAEAAEKTLTAEQKKKWEEMIGAKITYKRAPPPSPRNNRPAATEKEPEKKPPV